MKRRFPRPSENRDGSWLSRNCMINPLEISVLPEVFGNSFLQLLQGNTGVSVTFAASHHWVQVLVNQQNKVLGPLLETSNLDSLFKIQSLEMSFSFYSDWIILEFILNSKAYVPQVSICTKWQNLAILLVSIFYSLKSLLPVISLKLC